MNLATSPESPLSRYRNRLPVFAVACLQLVGVLLVGTSQWLNTLDEGPLSYFLYSVWWSIVCCIPIVVGLGWAWAPRGLFIRITGCVVTIVALQTLLALVRLLFTIGSQEVFAGDRLVDWANYFLDWFPLMLACIVIQILGFTAQAVLGFHLATPCRKSNQGQFHISDILLVTAWIGFFCVAPELLPRLGRGLALLVSLNPNHVGRFPEQAEWLAALAASFIASPFLLAAPWLFFSKKKAWIFMLVGSAALASLLYWYYLAFDAAFGGQAQFIWYVWLWLFGVGIGIAIAVGVQFWLLAKGGYRLSRGRSTPRRQSG